MGQKNYISQMEGKKPQSYLQEGKNEMIPDITAPILPFVGLAGIRLYSSREDLNEIISIKKYKLYGFMRKVA